MVPRYSRRHSVVTRSVGLKEPPGRSEEQCVGQRKQELSICPSFLAEQCRTKHTARSQPKLDFLPPEPFTAYFLPQATIQHACQAHVCTAAVLTTCHKPNLRTTDPSSRFATTPNVAVAPLRPFTETHFSHPFRAAKHSRCIQKVFSPFKVSEHVAASQN